jgi:hypothetical protein
MTEAAAIDGVPDTADFDFYLPATLLMSPFHAGGRRSFIRNYGLLGQFHGKF